MNVQNEVPDEVSWYGYDGDRDVRHLHELFYGKSLDAVQEYFGHGRSVERMVELLLVPLPVFQYYVHAFAQFVVSERAEADTDSANCFLSLLEDREGSDPDSVCSVIRSLNDHLNFIANNQAYFNAPIDVWGLFSERVARLRARCEPYVKSA